MDVNATVSKRSQKNSEPFKSRNSLQRAVCSLWRVSTNEEANGGK